MDSQPGLMVLLVIPLVLAVLTTLVGAAIQYFIDRRQRKAKNAHQQKERAKEICECVVQSMEGVLSMMKKSTFDVAWRKARPRDQEHDWTEPDTSLKQQDAKEWDKFLDLAREWRMKELFFETELMSNFGANSGEVFLYREIKHALDICISRLWKTYYIKKAQHLVDSAAPLLLYNNKLENNSTSETSIRSEESEESRWTREDELNNRREIYAIFEDTSLKIKKISLSMIICIQDHQVGNLRQDYHAERDTLTLSDGSKIMTFKEKD